MTHRWATHQGLPALRRNQTQRTIVCPGSPPLALQAQRGQLCFLPGFLEL